jgi:hypothetical protein
VEQDNIILLTDTFTIETSWFLQGDPRAVEATEKAKKFFMENVNGRLCSDEKSLIGLNFTISPDGESRRSLANASFPQSNWERSYIIGWYQYRLVALNTRKNGFSTMWTAEIKIIDKLGWERNSYDMFTPLAASIYELPTGGRATRFSVAMSNFWGNEANNGIDFLFGTSREFSRGHFELTGSVNCCKFFFEN